MRIKIKTKARIPKDKFKLLEKKKKQKLKSAVLLV